MSHSREAPTYVDAFVFPTNGARLLRKRDAREREREREREKTDFFSGPHLKKARTSTPRTNTFRRYIFKSPEPWDTWRYGDESKMPCCFQLLECDIERSHKYYNHFECEHKLEDNNYKYTLEVDDAIFDTCEEIRDELDSVFGCGDCDSDSSKYSEVTSLPTPEPTPAPTPTFAPTNIDDKCFLSCCDTLSGLENLREWGNFTKIEGGADCCSNRCSYTDGAYFIQYWSNKFYLTKTEPCADDDASLSYTDVFTEAQVQAACQDS